MRTRQNFSGPVTNTVLLLLLAVDCCYGSEIKPSQPAIKVRLLGVTILSDLASTSMLQTQVYHAVTGFTRFEQFIVRLMLSLQRHHYTPLSRPMLTAATVCWPGRQRPLAVDFSVG